MQGPPISTGRIAVPNSRYLADRLRAHARLYRHIAEETWNEDKAQELVRRAEECTFAADSIAAGAPPDSDVARPRRLQFR